MAKTKSKPGPNGRKPKSASTSGAASAPEVRVLKILDIIDDPEIQSRDVTDNPEEIAGRIEEYRGVIRAGKKFDRLPVVYEDTSDPEEKKYWLSEGFLRRIAHVDEGKSRMECEVRQGTRLDALLNSVASNQGHGLYRRNADKRRSVRMVLAACPTWSDRRIARHVGVHHDLVGEIRREGDDQVAESATSEREGADGKIYPVPPPKAEPPPQSAPPSVPLDKCVIPGEGEPEGEEEDANTDPAAPAPPPVALPKPPGSPVPSPPKALSSPPKSGPQEHGPAVPRDELGRPLPPYLVDVFAWRTKLKDGAAGLSRMLSTFRSADKSDELGGLLRRRPHLAAELEALSDYVKLRLAPYCVCPACEGDGDSEECPTCGGEGWLTRAGFENLYPALAAQAKHKGDPAVYEAERPDEKLVPVGAAERAQAGRDAVLAPIPKDLRDDFASDWLSDEARHLARLATALRSAASWLYWLKPEAHQRAAQLARDLEDAIPHVVCGHCKGQKCAACHLSGYHPKWSHEAGQSGVKGGAK